MTLVTRRAFVAGLAAWPVQSAAQTAMIPYVLAPNGTSVGFTFVLSGVRQSGTMPVQEANIKLDTARLQNSSVDVTLNVTKARTKLPFARGPMLGQTVLNANTFPTIRFSSAKIQLGPGGRISDGASVTGDLTVRGITRPVTLQASLYRPPGTAVDDLNQLSIGLTGSLNRNDFGASGYPDLVAETVRLDIRAKIIRA